jgi:hypothetical protein
VRENGDDVTGTPALPVPRRDDPALRQWSAIAHQFLAPIPAAARRVPSLVARAIFPPPLPAFADPLAG